MSHDRSKVRCSVSKHEQKQENMHMYVTQPWPCCSARNASPLIMQSSTKLALRSARRKLRRFEAARKNGLDDTSFRRQAGVGGPWSA